MKILLALSIAACSLLPACEREECLVETQGLSISELEEMVSENCRIVQEAIEAYAAENNLYYYPVDVYYDSSLAGHSLIELLPEGRLLINPFTNQPTEPVNRRAANPGEIGYEPLWRYYKNPGYTITGFGRDEIIVELSNVGALEDSVRRNCLLVQQAAEEFARRNDGCYPCALSDCTNCGESLIDLLPGGSYLRNPFSNCLCEPMDGCAACWGGTGYEALSPAGWCVGYKITGAGRDGSVLVRITNIGSSNEAMVIGNCLELQNAVKRFLLSTGGIFPRNLCIDTTPAGETVIDLLHGGNPFLRNPYTQNYDQPVERRAHYPGETGYEVLEEDGVPTGCIITGVGDSEGVLIFELASPFDCAQR